MAPWPPSYGRQHPGTAERLEELSSRNLVAMHRTFDNESHVSVPSVALSTAVSMAFGIRPTDPK